MKQSVGVFGAGAWGITLADLLARKGCDVCVWDVNSAAIAHLAKERSPAKLPELRIADSLRLTTDFGECARGAKVLLCAVPSFAVRSLCERLIPVVPRNLEGCLLVSVSKGIEEGTLLLPSQIVEEYFGHDAMQRVAALSGPSHAEEVSRRIPTVVVSASKSAETAERVRELFMMPEFRVYTQSDVLGVELGAALKNVIAIAAGGCDGLGFGDNTKAALVTRGLAEIARMGRAMGADAMTFAGLTGLGDLVVTAMSRHSRNRLFGELVASGRGVEQALEDVGQVVEGYRTSQSAHALAERLGVDAPIISAVHNVLHAGGDLRGAVSDLLTREPKPENV